MVTKLTQSALRVNGRCSESGRAVILTGPVDATALCLANAWEVQLDVSAAADGALDLYASHSDEAGNTSRVARQVAKAA